MMDHDDYYAFKSTSGGSGGSSGGGCLSFTLGWIVFVVVISVIGTLMGL